MVDSHCSFDDETLFPSRFLLPLMNKFFLLSSHVKMISRCNNTILIRWKPLLFLRTVFHKQSDVSLGKYMREIQHLIDACTSLDQSAFPAHWCADYSKTMVFVQAVFQSPPLHSPRGFVAHFQRLNCQNLVPRAYNTASYVGYDWSKTELSCPLGTTCHVQQENFYY